jgi:hypothetical protein
MFAFFSNKLGCLGSILISIIGTIILVAVMRGWPIDRALASVVVSIIPVLVQCNAWI